MGKVSVVTGGTSGIGRGIVEKILAHSQKDDKVFVTYVNKEQRAKEFLESLPEEYQQRVVLAKVDMSSYEEMIAFTEPTRMMIMPINSSVCTVIFAMKPRMSS